MSRLNFFNILIIVFFSFLINWYSANMGVLPIDTFGFFDTGYIILKGQLPVRDYWAYTGITVEKWDKSKSDNLFLLKTFIVKWIGIDPNKLQIQLLTSPASHTAKQCSVPTAVQEATIATDVASEVQVVSLLEINQRQKKITRKQRLRSQKQKQSVSSMSSMSSISSITFQITMEVPTDRTEDIVSVKKALSKLEKMDTGSEINIAAKEMTKELDCNSLQTVVRTKDSYVQEEGSTPPSKRTNATEVEELASHGDLNALTNTINATGKYKSK